MQSSASNRKKPITLSALGCIGFVPPLSRRGGQGGQISQRGGKGDNFKI